jgi:hypothetical protein
MFHNAFTKLVLPVCLFIFLGAAGSPVSPVVNDQRYLEDIKTLTQPLMEGRGDGTKGIEKAAQFLADNYKKFGLKPAGTNSYFQPFTVTTGARLQQDNRLEVKANGGSKPLKLNEDYVPLNFSAVGSLDSALVFAGYGVSSDEFQYDDYANLDVKGKIVVLLRYEPATFAQKSGNQGLTQHSHLITKAINARNHGAKAVILLNGKLGQGEEDLLMRFGTEPGPQDAGIMLVQVKNAVADSWFQAAGKSLGDVQQKINADGKPHSFAFPESVQASLTVDIEKLHATVNNVLAYLPGKTDEYVVIGAHYDHLGYGNADSLAPSQIGQIHPGADDNASGTAGVIELARYFSGHKEKLQRGILFASFAGEELGLLGSAEWVKEPTLPLDKDVAMLNMDMIGRLKDDKLFIGGIGTGSDFDAIVKKDAANYPFKIEYSAGGYAASDHTSFVTKQVPVLFFFSGLHSDYHKPSDTWEKINPHGAAELLAMVSDIASELANDTERPKFVKVDMPPPSSGGGERGYGPYFGSIPDFGETEKGVKFADVRPKSPAAKAGLQPGDVLVEFAGKPINNLYDFTDALRRSKVGDLVEVKVMRQGKPISAQVKLEQRH